MKFRLALLLSLILAFQLAGCSPAQPVSTIMENTNTLSGIKNALYEGTGTVRALKDGVLALGWPDSGGTRLVMINIASQRAEIGINKVISGGILNGATSEDVKEIFTYDGWKLLTKNQVPVELITAMNCAGSWLLLMSNSMPTMLIIPVKMYTTQEPIKQ
jgi:hypothetical protein